MTPPPQKECPVDTCDYLTPAGLPNYDLVYRDMEMHTRYGHQSPAPPDRTGDQGTGITGHSRADKLPRPSLKDEATEADFIFFKDSWTRYKRSTGLTGQAVVDQLWACCSQELSRSVYDSGVTSEATETALLHAMKKMAVRAQNNLVNVVNFLGMGQDNDEPGGSFAARLKGQASTCDFTIKCAASGCSRETSYMEKMVAHQLVRGLVDPTIQEEVLAHAASNPELDLASIQKFIEARETGRRSGALIASTGGLNRVSGYKSNQRERIRSSSQPPSVEKCHWCAKPGHGARASKEVREQKCKAYKAKCEKCALVGHFKVACKRKSIPSTANTINVAKDTITSGPFCNISTIVKKGRVMKTLPHYTYDMFRGWLKRKPEPHPAITVTMSLCETAYEDLNIPAPRVTTRQSTLASLPDTGAQMVVAGVPQLHRLGVTKRELIPLSNGISAADNSGLGLLGGVLVNIAGQADDGTQFSTKQLCYIAENIDCLFLSRQACRELGIIGEDFPSIGAFRKTSSALSNMSTETSPGLDDSRPCTCPARTLPPPCPTELPYPPTVENITKLEDWIKERYAGSAFNQCSHQPLPLIKSTPPLRLYVEETTRPVAVHKPVPIPMHWMKAVKEQLDKDVRLGVLEPVPVGEPVTWCSRMIVCPKKDMTPRRTVDLKCLNKAAARQTHATESPFHQAVSVPKHTFKTVLDAWEGYHSVPLAEEDRHFTCFITPFGRYRYKTCPQGFLASGDGYTSRYDKIVAGFSNFTKCVDDTLLWDNTVEEAFHRTCAYLNLCSENGIIFNKKKFVFSQKQVNFLGFEITEDSVRPAAKYLQAIQDFPKPEDITDIRSWFGLVNQVAYAFSMTSVMEPFRELLKPTSEFSWTDELDEAFKESKDVIVEAVKDGVMTFEMGRTTCLATDWSKQGMGFVLLQKYCSCKERTPICCSSGWKLVFAGSRFTSGAESRYAPVEGEALAAAYSLKKGRHFILGCKDLILAVDHKPLLNILGDKNLEDIDNPRILNLKEKTLRYSFEVVHVPGVKHKGADAASRHPAGDGVHLEIAQLTIAALAAKPQATQPVPDRLSKVFLQGLRSQATETDHEECLYLEQQTLGLGMNMLAGLSYDETGPDTTSQLSTYTVGAISSPKPISWQDVEQASVTDPTMTGLKHLVMAGMPDDKEVWPLELLEYHRHRDHLSSVGPVILYKGRAVIPGNLREQVLEVLHSAHQGVTSMVGRAAQAVFWPKMQEDITKTRQGCASCDKNTPSQPAAPPHPLPAPAYPFEMIAADFFSYAGKHFLIVVDRYSGWLSIYPAGADGASSLIKQLKCHFLTFGISSELSSDGGPEFTAASTQKFLKDWKVNFRLSSSYFPHSNQRAEVGVKTAKRILRENISPGGSTDTDTFLRALLTHRNTPDRDTNRSPAQVVFARPIKDFFPVQPEQFKPRSEWLLTAEQREVALAHRHTRQGQTLTEHTKVLKPLVMGDTVIVQNQTGLRKKKWDKSGIIVEVLDFDQYRIRMDGTGRVTLRNRRFLRPVTPYQKVPNNLTNSMLIPNENPPTQPIIPHLPEDESQPHAVLPHPAPISMRRSERIKKGIQGNILSNFTMK